MTAPVIAVIGGGQLARMMAPAATALGITLRVLVESADAPAAGAAHEIVVGEPGDAAAMAKLLAAPVPAVVTFEHEHIPASAFAACAAAGVPTRPQESALQFAQDKIDMRSRMDVLGLPNPSWRAVTTELDVARFLGSHGDVGVLKTARGGYDGKGVRVIHKAAEAADWLAAAAAGGPRVLIEEKVPFTRELAIQVARRPSGQVRAWTTVESRQADGVCAEVVAPAPRMREALDHEAQRLAEVVATKLDVTGVLTVEMFEVNQRLVVNELAMRPHNSGHWTIDGAVTSQFEQHLRAVLDVPLGDPAMVQPWAVMVNVLGGTRTVLTDALADVGDGGAKVHLYGKAVRPGRKVGHVNVTSADLDVALTRARAAAAIVKDGGVT